MKDVSKPWGRLPLRCMIYPKHVVVHAGDCYISGHFNVKITSSLRVERGQMLKLISLCLLDLHSSLPPSLLEHRES